MADPTQPESKNFDPDPSLVFWLVCSLQRNGETIQEPLLYNFFQSEIVFYLCAIKSLIVLTGCVW